MKISTSNKATAPATTPTKTSAAAAPTTPKYGIADKVLMVIADADAKGVQLPYHVGRGVICGIVPNRRSPDGIEYCAHIEGKDGQLLSDESGTPFEIYDLDYTLIRPRTKEGRAELEKYMADYVKAEKAEAEKATYTDAKAKALAFRSDLDEDRLNATPASVLPAVYMHLAEVTGADVTAIKGLKKADIIVRILQNSAMARQKKAKTSKRLREEALAVIAAFKKEHPEVVAAEEKAAKERAEKAAANAANLEKARAAKAETKGTKVLTVKPKETATATKAKAKKVA